MPVAIEYEKGHEFDFCARYTAEFVSLDRPDLPEELLDRLGEVARQAHRTLGLRDVSRSDFIVGADGSLRRPRDRDHPGHHRDLGVPVRLHRQRYDARRGRPRPAGPRGRRRPARLTA